MREVYPYLRIEITKEANTGQPMMVMHCESPRKIMVVPMSQQYALKLSRDLASVAINVPESNGNGNGHAEQDTAAEQPPEDEPIAE